MSKLLQTFFTCETFAHDDLTNEFLVSVNKILDESPDIRAKLVIILALQDIINNFMPRDNDNIKELKRLRRKLGI